jgi:hypothetical protein
MRHRTLGGLLAAALLAACASEVRREPVEMSTWRPAAEIGYELPTDVSFKLDSGYPRTVRALTAFAVVGRVPQGLVLRPTEAVLTVEGAHMHEAYVVWAEGQLVGFYLPKEKAFSPLHPATPFPLVQRKN